MESGLWEDNYSRFLGPINFPTADFLLYTHQLILRTTDIAATTEIVRTTATLLASSSTWAGPVVQKSLALGAKKHMQRIRQEMRIHLGASTILDEKITLFS